MPQHLNNFPTFAADIRLFNISQAIAATEGAGLSSQASWIDQS
jgi:hypothetical protein